MIYSKQQAEDLWLKETVSLRYVLLREQARRELKFIDKIKLLFNIK
jgi:hypothetical protein